MFMFIQLIGVFIDATTICRPDNIHLRNFTKMIIQDIYKTMGITTTRTGTNHIIQKVANGYCCLVMIIHVNYEYDYFSST